MAKIREDLVGVVYASGKYFKAGDAIPAGVNVDKSLVEPVKVPEVEKPGRKPRTSKKQDD